jgi:hypothetical protein
LIRIELPIKTVNGLNVREHPMARHRRTKATREIVGLKLNGQPKPALPVRVLLTRRSKGLLDKHDGLPAALKPVVDEVAKWLGVDDADPRVTWSYIQERAPTFGVRIEVTPVEAAP